MIQQLTIEIIPEDKETGLACTRDFFLPTATARSEKPSDNSEYSSAESSSLPKLTPTHPHCEGKKQPQISQDKHE